MSASNSVKVGDPEPGNRTAWEDRYGHFWVRVDEYPSPDGHTWNPISYGDHQLGSRSSWDQVVREGVLPLKPVPGGFLSYLVRLVKQAEQ